MLKIKVSSPSVSFFPWFHVYLVPAGNVRSQGRKNKGSFSAYWLLAQVSSVILQEAAHKILVSDKASIYLGPQMVFERAPRLRPVLKYKIKGNVCS
jgi:hypothetical protein